MLLNEMWTCFSWEMKWMLKFQLSPKCCFELWFGLLYNLRKQSNEWHLLELFVLFSYFCLCQIPLPIYVCAVTLSFILSLLTTRGSTLSTKYSLTCTVRLCIPTMSPVTPGWPEGGYIFRCHSISISFFLLLCTVVFENFVQTFLLQLPYTLWQLHDCCRLEHPPSSFRSGDGNSFVGGVFPTRINVVPFTVTLPVVSLLSTSVGTVDCHLK